MWRVCTSCSGAFRWREVGEAASRSMCTDPERGGERSGSTVWSVGLDGLGGRSRLWVPVPAFAFTTLGARSGLRLHDSGYLYRPSPSRLWLLVPAFANMTMSVLAVLVEYWPWSEVDTGRVFGCACKMSIEILGHCRGECFALSGWMDLP